uniref:Uncharacterized protein n=1 Tax=Nymphaea colorata TaxID=210225 RepID=A0A5K1B4U5_9MAGN
MDQTTRARTEAEESIAKVPVVEDKKDVEHMTRQQKIMNTPVGLEVQVPEAPESQVAAPPPSLTRQASGKLNCLCSPTTHAGSFRCRLHRGPLLQRTKSFNSGEGSNAP